MEFIIFKRKNAIKLLKYPINSASLMTTFISFEQSIQLESALTRTNQLNQGINLVYTQI